MKANRNTNTCKHLVWFKVQYRVQHFLYVPSPLNEFWVVIREIYILCNSYFPEKCTWKHFKVCLGIYESKKYFPLYYACYVVYAIKKENKIWQDIKCLNYWEWKAYY